MTVVALTISPLTLFLFCSVGALSKRARSSDHSASNWPILGQFTYALSLFSALAAFSRKFLAVNINAKFHLTVPLLFQRSPHSRRRHQFLITDNGAAWM